MLKKIWLFIVRLWRKIMSLYNCHKQQPQPWMSYISRDMITFPGKCCPSLVTNTLRLLPFQIISNGVYVRAEISPYGEDTWTEITLTVNTVYTDGFFIHSYHGQTLASALSCGAYDFRVVAGETWWFEPIMVEDFEIVTNSYTIRNLLPLPLKFGEQPIDGIPIIAPCDSILPFMFVTDALTTGTVVVNLVDEDGGSTALTITVEVVTISGKTYYIHEGTCLYPFIACGRYRLEIVDGVTYYSVWMNFECSLEDIPDGYRVLRDFNGCVMRDENGVILYEECSELPTILLNRTGTPSMVYLYNLPLKTIELLSVTGITASSSDIAHTENKLWLFSTLNVSPFTRRIAEWDITLDPFTAVFNKYITTGGISGAGLCVKDENTLIIDEFIAPGGIFQSRILECDITTEPSTNTYKFSTLAGRTVVGDYILTNTNKFIVTTDSDSNTRHFISQYDYATGVLEIDIEITAYTFRNYGLIQYNNEIYIVDYRSSVITNIWRISKTPPYGLTLYDTLSFGFYGASQILSGLTTEFST